MALSPGSISSDVPAGSRDDLGPPVASASSSSPVRPLLLRSDVAWTPEDNARGPGSSSASASSRSISAISSGYVPSRGMLGERILRDYEAYMAGLRDGVGSAVGLSGEVAPGLTGGVTQRERDAYRAGVEVGFSGAVEARALSMSDVGGSAISARAVPATIGGAFLSGLRAGMGEEESPAPVGVRDPHVNHAYTAGMRWSAGGAYERSVDGSAGLAEEETAYELPPSVADRLAVGEALSAAHRLGRIKRRREDEKAELDDVAGSTGSDSGPPRDDDADGGGGGVTGGGCKPT